MEHQADPRRDQHRLGDSLGRLHDRCDKFSRGLRYVVWTVGLAFLAYIFQILLKLLP